jgi:hypothetical protein
MKLKAVFDMEGKKACPLMHSLESDQERTQVANILAAST